MEYQIFLRVPNFFCSSYQKTFLFIKKILLVLRIEVFLLFAIMKISKESEVPDMFIAVGILVYSLLIIECYPIIRDKMISK